jgi:hypothetical protein
MSNERSKQIPPHICLDNDSFQDWMAEANIMHRVDIPQERLGRKQRVTHEPSLGDQVFDYLLDRYQFVVSREAVSRVASPGHDEASAAVASRWVGDARDIMDNPEHLSGFHGVGWSIGVDEFALRRDHLPLVYDLWQNMTEYVERDRLALVLFGYADESTRNSVRDQMADVKKLLRNNAAIEIDYRTATDDRTAAYKLREKNVQDDSLLPFNPNVPPHLSLSFQNWLAQRNVGILKRKKGVRALPITLKEGEEYGHSEGLAASALSRFAGYIVPTEYLSTLLHGTPDKKDKINPIIEKVRKKITDENIIYTARGLGYGKGVSALRVRRIPLILLNKLWTNPEDFVRREDLFSALEEYEIKHNRKTLTLAVSELRGILRSSEYTIETVDNKMRGELAYSLKKSGDIFPEELTVR